MGIVLHSVVAENSRSVGLGESVHYSTQRTYLRLKHDNPTADHQHFLHVAVTAHNDCAGIDGLVPTMLVYEAFPRVSVRLGGKDDDAPTNSERAAMRKTATKEFTAAVELLRLKTTETYQAPTIPHSIFLGDRVLFWLKAKPKKWDGPFPVISVVPHLYYVKISQKLPQQLYASSTAKKFISGVLVDNLLPPENRHLDWDDRVEPTSQYLWKLMCNWNKLFTVRITTVLWTLVGGITALL